jgi:hypothetical protein
MDHNLILEDHSLQDARVDQELRALVVCL